MGKGSLYLSVSFHKVALLEDLYKGEARRISAREEAEQWQTILLLMSCSTEWLVPRKTLTENSPVCHNLSIFHHVPPDSVCSYNITTPLLPFSFTFSTSDFFSFISFFVWYHTLFFSLFWFSILHINKKELQICQAFKSSPLLICHYFLLLCHIYA